MYLCLIIGIFLSFRLLVEAQKRPNIIYIMSDDHTTQAIGVYNSRLAVLNPTPVIDRLAKEGMVFENTFCTNSICTPSRACIMTGQYNHINGCLTLNDPLPQKRHDLSHLMKEAGYSTAVIGKWHLREVPSGFDYYCVLPGQGKYFDPEFYTNKGGEKRTLTLLNDIKKDVNVLNYKGHSTDIITYLGIDWLKKAQKSSAPFFMMLQYKAPHDFFEYAPRYENYLEDITIPEPPSLYNDKNHGSIATKGADGKLSRYIGTSIGGRNVRRNYTKDFLGRKDNPLDSITKSQAYQVYLKKYLRCVKGIDENLDRLFDFLKQEGLYENTIIVYTADQGMMLGEHDYQDKRWGYEESLKMPLIIKYPGTQHTGIRTDALIENIDFAPTLLDLAGIKIPDFMQGRSFKSILETGREQPSWKKETYYQYWMHMAYHDVPAHFLLRTKDYKLIFYYGKRAHPGSGREKLQTPPGWELYDLRTDPFEMNNVYDDPTYSEVQKELKKRLKEKRKKIGVDDPSVAPNTYVADEIKNVNRLVRKYWDYDANDRKKATEITSRFLKEVK
jgi:arylsulfatase A-like enzyme